MTAFSNQTTEWALVLGTVTLVCWMAAGFTAVVGTREEIRHPDQGKASEYLTTALTVAGFTAASLMSVVLVFAQ